MTSNPFKRVMTGLGITAIIQSSSATTVMVVSFVNAGLLTLAQAIGVIMGANIGTTVTAWLVSLLGFKADISIFAVPLMAVGFIMSIAKSEKYKNISEFIIGFSLLFLGLSLMKNSVPDLSSTPEVLSFIKEQLKEWKLAKDNTKQLKDLQVKSMEVAGLPVKVQFNPARIGSTTAKTDTQSIQKRGRKEHRSLWRDAQIHTISGKKRRIWKDY
mgnify:CR=1 FL=1